MHIFGYEFLRDELLPAKLVTISSNISALKAMAGVRREAYSEEFKKLETLAKVESVKHSNALEGIVTTDQRIQAIVGESGAPLNHTEAEIAGYRDVLATVHENYQYILPRPGFILQLHRDLYKFTGKSIGGSYKVSDNVIAEEHDDGSQTVRFIPVPAWETAETMNSLCDAFNKAVDSMEMDPLILIPMFILDFLCIHPFNDGNGRMSRLLTLLLLYRADFNIGKYISIEKLIADTKESYYEALQASSYGWHEGTNNYAPFVSYMLGIIVAAYRDFNARTEIIGSRDYSKPDRIREAIKNKLGKITKREIMALCPDISQVTVQRTLNDLLKNGEIIKIGGGRYTSYVWNGDK